MNEIRRRPAYSCKQLGIHIHTIVFCRMVVGKGLKAKGSIRFIFFLAEKAINDGNYSFSPYMSQEHTPFYIIDQNRCAYLCIYQDRTANNVNADLMFNIASQKYKGGNQQQKTKIIKNNDSYPRQDSQIDTYMDSTWW